MATARQMDKAFDRLIHMETMLRPEIAAAWAKVRALQHRVHLVQRAQDKQLNLLRWTRAHEEKPCHSAQTTT